MFWLLEEDDDENSKHFILGNGVGKKRNLSGEEHQREWASEWLLRHKCVFLDICMLLKYSVDELDIGTERYLFPRGRDWGG